MSCPDSENSLKKSVQNNMWNIMNMNPAIPGLVSFRRIASLFLLIFFTSAAMFSQSAKSNAIGTSPSSQIEEPSGDSPALLSESGSLSVTVQPRLLPDEPQPVSSEGNQSKRILSVISNHEGAGADAPLPPLSVTSKFVLATRGSFDYSTLIFTGVVAGIGQAQNSTTEFRQGGIGYSRYLWHSFADRAVGNYFTKFIVPTVTHEDPRYYTRLHGGVLNRTAYALGQLAITRTDSGGSSVNFSEIAGSGAGAGMAYLYYPRAERTWTKTGQRWATKVSMDGMSNVVKEFWPDIRHHVFRK
jgi:hypothetical protein